jgi:putative methyltransferase (TIGR04325 family)
VLDFGGHRGSLYYSSRRLLGDGPKWSVYDVPAVVEEGRRVAASKGAAALTFESDLSRVPHVDLVIAAGSLQYVEDRPREWLEKIAGERRHVIVSTTPFHESREFATLNNMGTAYCPYKVRRKGEFFDEMRELGYRVVEEWHHPGKACQVPFHVGPWEVTYRGALFERR